MKEIIELKKLLAEHPELNEYQARLNIAMAGLAPDERVVFLASLMKAQILELSKQWTELAKTLEKIK